MDNFLVIAIDVYTKIAIRIVVSQWTISEKPDRCEVGSRTTSPIRCRAGFVGGSVARWDKRAKPIRGIDWDFKMGYGFV